MKFATGDVLSATPGNTALRISSVKEHFASGLNKVFLKRVETTIAGASNTQRKRFLYTNCI